MRPERRRPKSALVVAEWVAIDLAVCLSLRRLDKVDEVAAGVSRMTPVRSPCPPAHPELDAGGREALDLAVDVALMKAVAGTPGLQRLLVRPSRRERHRLKDAARPRPRRRARSS